MSTCLVLVTVNNTLHINKLNLKCVSKKNSERDFTNQAMYFLMLPHISDSNVCQCGFDGQDLHS